jgi:hypothetical protein
MDGEYLIAGGKSKYICIYNIKEEMLVKKFEISQNKSFDGTDVIFCIFFYINKTDNFSIIFYYRNFSIDVK